MIKTEYYPVNCVNDLVKMARGSEMFTTGVLLLVCALLSKGVSPHALGPAVIIGEHEESLREKEAANHLKAQSFDQQNHHGDKVNENQNSLTDNKSNQFVGAKDSGHYNNQDADKKVFDESKYQGGQNFNHDSGERVSGIAQKKGHKKGHHNAGFHNSYHKDETSNNSSYFDDASDENDESNYQNGRGRFGNESGNKYSTRKEDGRKHIQDNARNGNYDRRGGHDSRNAEHRDYDRKRYQDDRRDALQNQKAQSYAGKNRGYSHAEQAPQYHSGPSYYDGPEYRPSGGHHGGYHDEPHHSLRRSDYSEGRDRDRSQTITIYEDPRIDDPYNGKGALRGPAGESERVRLDVRPGGRRYQRYDSYYEPPRARKDWGVNRRSDINPLVFNYNKY